MEIPSSCSSPLSVHTTIGIAPTFITPPRRRVSAKFDCHGHRRTRKILSISPNCTFLSSPISTSTTATTSTSCCSTTSSSYYGISISHSGSVKTLSLSSSSRKRSLPIVSAVFERFTERAIKAVMFSQREAKTLGKDMVFTQHLLLGLIAEDRATDGFLNSGITIDVAREAVRSIWQDDDSSDQNSVTSEASSSVTSATDVPFSKFSADGNEFEIQ
uniref:Clp R domain-containing protein n=1 Tax=Davidia involucrata TaxID=16924 RepID=A0A5B7BK32_DAVIN